MSTGLRADPIADKALITAARLLTILTSIGIFGVIIGMWLSIVRAGILYLLF